MNSINIKTIADVRGDHCISIYMPTTHVPTDWNKNSVRMKNLIRKVEEDMKILNTKGTLINRLTRPLWDLQEDTRFLQEMKSGAVFFSAPDFFEYHLLSAEIHEFAVVSDCFLIKPLFHLFTYNTEYYLLTLSKHQVSLYKADRFSIEELKIPDAPENMEEFLRFDEENEYLQFHTRTPSQGDKRAAVFHGHGVGTDKKLEKEKSARYVKAVEQAVSSLLKTDTLPLILFTVEYMQGIYRKENTYVNLAEENISGSPDRMKIDELHKEGWNLVSRIADSQIHAALQEFNNERDENKIIGKTEQVVQETYSGKVHALFVSYEDLVWGEFNEETATATQYDEWKPGASELLDLALRFTWMNGGGMVYALNRENMPDLAGIAAVYRY